MRQGLVYISHKMLEDLLQLPEGNQIKRITQELDDEYRRSFKVIVEGPLMPEVHEGFILQRLTPDVTVEGKINWKQLT